MGFNIDEPTKTSTSGGYYSSNNIQNKKNLEIDLGLRGGAKDDNIPENGFTIVLTNLVGSSKKDIKHIDKIVEYKKTMKILDEKEISYKEITGLREIQIQDIFNKIQIYTGMKPSILIGNIGAVIRKDTEKDPMKINENTVNLFFNEPGLKDDDKFKNMSSNEKKELIFKYYTFDKLTSSETIYKNINEIIAKNFGSDFEKITESYYNIETNKSQSVYKIDTEQKITNFDNGVTQENVKYKKINPDTSFFRMSDPDKSKLSLNTLTKEDIKKTFSLLDTLLSYFTLGKLSYIKRDLGCFDVSVEKESYKSIKDHPYSFRKHSEKKEELETLYTLNFPTFIETLLNQKTNNFNNDYRKNYYSENQYSIDETIKFEKPTPIFDKYTDENKTHLQLDSIMDVYIRLLMVPTNDLEKIAGEKLTDGSKRNIVNYLDNSKEYSLTFYKQSQGQLENRLKNIMNYKTEEKKNFLDILLETDKTTNKLKNLTFKNKDLIFKLYEVINILLKLRFYNYIIDDLSNAIEPVAITKGGKIEKNLLEFTNNKSKSNFFTPKKINKNKKTKQKHKTNNKYTIKNKKYTLKKKH